MFPVKVDVDVGELRRATSDVEKRQLVKVLALELPRREAGRRQRTLEDFAVLVEEFLQPDGVAAAFQRIRSESQVEKAGKEFLEKTVQPFHHVPVQPEISEIGRERIEDFRCDRIQRAVV